MSTRSRRRSAGAGCLAGRRARSLGRCHLHEHRHVVVRALPLAVLSVPLEPYLAILVATTLLKQLQHSMLPWTYGWVDGAGHRALAIDVRGYGRSAAPADIFLRVADSWVTTREDM